jgi:hypothetical protein
MGARLKRLEIWLGFNFVILLVLENEREELVIQNVDELACPHRKVNDAVFEGLPLGEEQSNLLYEGRFADSNKSMDKHSRVSGHNELNDCLSVDLAANNALSVRLLDFIRKNGLLVDELNITLLEWTEGFAFVMPRLRGVMGLTHPKTVDIEKFLRNAI